MSRLKTAFCILIFTLAGCSHRSLSEPSLIDSDNSASGIVNGKEAKAADVAAGGFANSVVSVYDFGVMCTGVLIAPQLVLTAAHCFFDSNPSFDVSRMSVTFQSLQTGKNTPQRVSKIVFYPGVKAGTHSLDLDELTEESADDLALVLLSQPAPVSVRPATLAKSAFSEMVMTSVTAVGYGTAINTDANDGSDTVGTLRYTSFDSRSIRTLHGMILVKNSNSGICHGDSGGPLFEGNPASAKNIVVGLNNFALPFPKTFWQEVHWYLAEKSNSLNDYSDAYPDQDLCVGVNGFVDVASHRAWIIKAAASLGVVIQ